MDITPLVPAGRQIIQSYTGGSFKINGQLYSSAVFVHPEHTRLWPVSTVDVAGLSLDDMSIAFHQNIELILLGCGRQAKSVSPLLRQALRAQGIGLETMDTGAACRTYNVLMAEGRLVAAALLPML